MMRSKLEGVVLGLVIGALLVACAYAAAHTQ